MKYAVVVAFVIGIAACARAQVDGVPRDLIEQRIEAAAEQLGGEADLSNLFEILTDRYLDPIDLNHTDAQELSTILLLSDVQISDILQHRQRFGRFLNVYELQTLNSMDVRTIRMILPFVEVRENPLGSTASLREILNKGTHEITVRSTMNIESRRGFMDRPSPFGKDFAYADGDPLPDFADPNVVDSLRRNNRVYLGSPFRVYTRYRFRYRQNISFGFTAEKDEGEEFFRGTQPNGFDYYSAHLFVRNIGRLKALAIGDYQAQFGQGLTFWNGLGFAAKSSFTMNVKRNAPGLAPYTSVNENLFLRGVAATFDVGKHFEVTAFGSRKNIDANVQSAAASAEDSLGINQGSEVIFSSFLEDGFHRTFTEVSRKDALGENIVGGHVAYKRRSMTIGATAAHVEYTGALSRNVQPYNQFDFNGAQNTTAGLDWNVLYRNLTWFGEAATSANGGMAMNTGVLLSLDKRVSMSMLYRNYGRDFHGLYSVAFAEGTNPWNERGRIALAGQTREHEHALPQLRPRFPWALQCGLRRRHQPVERTRALHRLGDPPQPPVDDQCLLRPVHLPVAALPHRCTEQRLRLAGSGELAPEQAGGDLRSRAPSGPRAQHRCGCGWHRSAGACGTDQLPGERELQGERVGELAYAGRDRGFPAGIIAFAAWLPALPGCGASSVEQPLGTHLALRALRHGGL